MRYELWYSASEGCHIFFPVNQRPTDFSADARLLWVVEAGTWDEAQTAKHEFLGWKPYIPMSDANDQQPPKKPTGKRNRR